MSRDQEHANSARPFSALAALCGIRPIYNAQDLLAEFSKGLRDVPVAIDHSLKGDQHRSGMLAMAGRFIGDDFDRALMVTNAGGVTEPRDGMVDPKFILAQAWHPQRLASAQRRVERNEEPYPVELNGIRFPGLPEFYSVTDGIHRVVAARLAGKEEIPAHITSYTICDPNRYEIRDGKVINPSRPSPWANVENEAVLTILTSLGVPENITFPQKMMRPIVKKLMQLQK